MANVAYLYSSDNGDFEAAENWSFLDQRFFFDHFKEEAFRSHNRAPLAWMLFFRLADLKKVPVVYLDAQWSEMCFFVERETALERMNRQRPLLIELLDSPFDCGRFLDDLVRVVFALPGKYLLFDPTEIEMWPDDDDDAWSAYYTRNFDRFGRELDSETPDRSYLARKFGGFFSKDAPLEKWRDSFIGSIPYV